MADPYAWDVPTTGDIIDAGNASGYSDPPTKTEIDSEVGINQILAAFRKEKNDLSLTFATPAYVSGNTISTASDWNAWFIDKQAIQKARIGTTHASDRYPVSAGDIITPAHVTDLQFIDSEFDTPPDYQGVSGDVSGQWQTRQGVSWLQSDSDSWQAMLNGEWLGLNYRTNASAVTVHVARWSDHLQHFHYLGAMKYGTVGNGYPGDPADLDSVTDAYVDIGFEWLSQGTVTPDHDQKIAVLLGLDTLTHPTTALTLDSGSSQGVFADRVYIAYASCALYAPGDIVRVYETSGFEPNYTGEQRTVVSVVTGAPSDPAQSHYLILSAPLSLTYHPSKDAVVWQVEDHDRYQQADVSIQAIIDTNDAINTVRVYLDTGAIYNALTNDSTLELYVVPLLLMHEPEQADGARKFFCAAYPGDIYFDYTKTAGSCDTGCEVSCETQCELLCETQCETACEPSIE